MNIAVLGMAEKEKRVLLCRRLGLPPYSGCWEFPGAWLEGENSVEETVENAFFERITAVFENVRLVSGANWPGKESVRMLLCRGEIRRFCKPLSGYAECRWVKIKDLKRFRLAPWCVMLVKPLKFF